MCLSQVRSTSQKADIAPRIRDVSFVPVGDIHRSCAATERASQMKEARQLRRPYFWRWLGRLGQLEPFLSDPEPRLFVERANDASRVLSGFLSLLSKPSCLIGHPR